MSHYTFCYHFLYSVACSFFQNIYRKKKEEKHKQKIIWKTESTAVSIQIRFFDWRGFIPHRTLLNTFPCLKGKKKLTLYPWNYRPCNALKCLIPTALIHAFTRNQAVKCMSVRTVCKKKVSPWGVSWERVLRSKKCVQICKANNWSWGIQKRGCAHERTWNWTFFYGNFSLCHARYGFFCFFSNVC